MSFLSNPKKCDYGSDFSDRESDVEFNSRIIKSKNDNLFNKPSSDKLGLFNSSGKKSFIKPPSKRHLDIELDKQEGKRMRYHGILAMDAYSRHKKFVNDYLIYYGGKPEDFKMPSRTYLSDNEVIKNNNQFIWDDEGNSSDNMNYEKKLAKKYWDKLFKEYAIADLTYFKENKIALRWRIEKEVVVGKGQFSCGNKKCNEESGLRSWEVNFAYIESGEKKNALVKLRLCPECSYKLNFHHKKREVTRKKLKKESKKSKKHKKKSRQDPSSSVKNPTSPKGVEKGSSTEEDIWSQPVKVDLEKTREEEFDKYFEDMFE
ncbi:protein FRA10AC1-like [Styela clava]